MPRPRPAQSKAVDFLLAYVSSSGIDPGKILPPVRELATSAGVAYATMWAALRRLSDAGAIQVKQGKRIVLRSKELLQGQCRQFSGSPSRPLSGPKWQRTSRRIRHDIERGVHPLGAPLPSTKELMRRYGTCHRTMRKAIDRLVETGHLLPQRQGYRVAAPVLPGRRGTVVLIARSDSRGSLSLSSVRTYDHYRALEAQCSRLNLNLRVVPFNYTPGGFYRPSPGDPLVRELAGSDSIMGFLLWTLGIGRPYAANILRRLDPLGKPIGVLDEGPATHSASRRRPRSPVRLFTMAHSESPGLEVGRYLLRLGHRRVAFISIYKDVVWAINRHRGLVRAFEEEGFAGAVEHFATEKPRRARPRVGEIIDNALRRDHPDYDSLARAIKGVSSYVSLRMDREFVARHLTPLLEMALARRDITAWVAANDNIALEAQDFLAGHGRKTPRDLSLIGFDDTMEAFINGLSSYNFSAPAVMNAMLSHIIDPRRPWSGHRRDSPMEIEGYVATRTSTGTPRSPSPWRAMS